MLLVNTVVSLDLNLHWSNYLIRLLVTKGLTITPALLLICHIGNINSHLTELTASVVYWLACSHRV